MNSELVLVCPLCVLSIGYHNLSTSSPRGSRFSLFNILFFFKTSLLRTYVRRSGYRARVSPAGFGVQPPQHPPIAAQYNDTAAG